MEAILTRFSKRTFSLLALAGLMSPAALAGSKESGHDMLVKSFQQANLWTQGPVKMVAHMRLPKGDGTDVNFDYTVSWAGPERWRAEWTANGLDQVTVLNNGKLSYLSNQPAPLVQLLQFEAALEALDGGNPAGPYTIPPLDVEKSKIDTSKKKINNVDARCVALGDPLETFCIDPATAHILTLATTISHAEIGSFDYGDYTSFGPTAYPQTIKVNYAGKLLEEGKVTVTRGEKFADALFIAPEKSTTTDLPSCADVDRNFTAPRTSKSVPPTISDTLKKAKKYGLVWVLANVAKDGSVQKATVIGGDPDLKMPATDAVQQYKFTPYMRCGQAVEFQKVVVVPFLPPQTSAADQGSVITPR